MSSIGPPFEERPHRLSSIEYGGVSGEPEGRLIEGRGPLGESVDAAGAVEHRILGMDVEMGEAHRDPEDTSGVRRLRPGRRGDSRWMRDPRATMLEPR